MSRNDPSGPNDAPERPGRGTHGGHAVRTEAGHEGPFRPGAGPPKRRRGPLRRVFEFAVITLFAAAVAAAGAGTWAWTQLRAVDPGTPDTVAFEVLPGWGAARVADELEAAGLIRDATVFTLYLRWQELDRGIGEGLYDLSPSGTARELANALVAGGRPRTVRLVIPEGWRARDVAERLGAMDLADPEAVLARVTNPGAMAPAWLPDGAGLEGYLFPDTYELRADADADDALAVTLEHFNDQLAATPRERIEAAGLDVHGWVTLASMVQAEADGPDEMPIIAGVFLNRLDLGMLLQSDPTVAYGLGKDLPDLSAVDGDLRVDHPWNTYTRPGLPLGPIGNPGRDALDAVLAPERTRDDGVPWLYFLHGSDDDGQPVFRPNVDLASHNRDIDRFLR